MKCFFFVKKNQTEKKYGKFKIVIGGQSVSQPASSQSLSCTPIGWPHEIKSSHNNNGCYYLNHYFGDKKSVYIGDENFEFIKKKKFKIINYFVFSCKWSSAMNCCCCIHHPNWFENFFVYQSIYILRVCSISVSSMFLSVINTHTHTHAHTHEQHPCFIKNFVLQQTKTNKQTNRKMANIFSNNDDDHIVVIINTTSNDHDNNYHIDHDHRQIETLADWKKWNEPFWISSSSSSTKIKIKNTNSGLFAYHFNFGIILYYIVNENQNFKIKIK